MMTVYVYLFNLYFGKVNFFFTAVNNLAFHGQTIVNVLEYFLLKNVCRRTNLVKLLTTRRFYLKV